MGDVLDEIDFGAPSVLRKAVRAAAIWLGLVFATCLVPPPLTSVQFFGLFFGSLIYLGFVLYYLVSAGLAARRAWPARGAVAKLAVGVPALLIASILITPSVLWAGNRAFVWGTVLIARTWLDGRVEEARRKPPEVGATTVEEHGYWLPWHADDGPPVRVVFLTNPGFLDNWSGIVFDPTRAVEQARGWDAKGKFYAPERVTKLFGGDLVGCDRLVGFYYYCGFT